MNKGFLVSSSSGKKGASKESSTNVNLPSLADQTRELEKGFPSNTVSSFLDVGSSYDVPMQVEPVSLASPSMVNDGDDCNLPEGDGVNVAKMAGKLSLSPTNDSHGAAYHAPSTETVDTNSHGVVGVD